MWMQRQARRVALVGLAVLSAGALAGCAPAATVAPAATATPEATTPISTPQPTPIPTESTSLQATAARVVFHGVPVITEASQCAEQALLTAGLSDAALAQLEQAQYVSVSSAIVGLQAELPDDAAALQSAATRAAIEQCELVQYGEPEKPAKPVKYIAPEAVPVYQPEKPNTKPTFTIHQNAMLRSASVLQPGVASMFGSFALNDEQRAIYEAASQCMAERIANSNLSDPALRFIAEGAPLGAGTIADHFTSAEDRELWNSTTFQQGLNDCATAAQLQR